MSLARVQQSVFCYVATEWSFVGWIGVHLAVDSKGMSLQLLLVSIAILAVSFLESVLQQWSSKSV